MEHMKMRKCVEFIVRNSSWAWGAGLLALATILSLCSRHHPQWDLLHSLAEFCGLAGLLTITVDPFLKRKLQREAARDIFHHLLGLDLPVEIRETLRDFLITNTFYRRGVSISAHVSREQDHVEVLIEFRATVVAVSRTSYCQHIQVEESENAQLLQASITSTVAAEKSYSKIGEEVRLKEASQKMVLEWKGPAVALARGEELSTFFKMKSRRPLHGFHTLNFGSAVIHPRVRLEAAGSLDVVVDRADQTNGNEYIYNKVFLQGDHIQIRWKPK